MKKNLKYLIPALILIGLFYWFQIRPSQIRKYCATKKAEYLSSNWNKGSENSLLKVADVMYDTCLNLKGMK